MADRVDRVAKPIKGGKFTDVVTDYANQYIKDADANIIKDLKARDLLLRHDTLDHSYPFCPRTNTPLIYRSVPSWFVNVTKIKDKMIKNNHNTFCDIQHLFRPCVNPIGLNTKNTHRASTPAGCRLLAIIIHIRRFIHIRQPSYYQTSSLWLTQLVIYTNESASTVLYQH